MIRSAKKMRLNDASKSGYVQSGNFMTSCLHDQPEYTDEMPIASPDAQINEVPVNSINPEQDEEIINNETKENESINSMSNVKLNTPTDKVLTSNESQLSTKNASLVRHGSISGGLTLDRTNKSLKNLIFYIKTAYSNRLTSPKWKNFKGLKLQVIEKIRLNNVIWRTWFEQYGNKNSKNARKQRSLLCQFAITLEEQPAASARVAKLEGEYWKQKLAGITNEYKKWREISRKQIKSTSDGIVQLDHPVISAINANKYKQCISRSSSPYNSQKQIEYNYYNEPNQMDNNSINNQSYGYVNNNNNFYSSNDTNFNNLMNNNNLNYNIQQSSNFYTTSSTNNLGTSSAMNSNNNSNVTTGYHHPIASKQIPYSNRCRSPSPGLFNDVDLFNFSSDTLFSTLCFEDPKDPIFGTNPDLFQPDLMHLYPNFGFLDLDLNFNDSNINTNTTANVNTYDTTSNQVYNSSTTKLAPSLTTPPAQSVANAPSVMITTNVEPTTTIVSTTENTLPIYIQPTNTNIPNKTISNMNTINATPQQVSSNSTSQQQPPYITTESSDLYNFNTLATVAAAQSPNISPNPESRSRKNNAFKQNISGKNLKAINSGKLSNSLSQMSTVEPKVVSSSLAIEKNAYLDNSTLIMSQNINNSTNNTNATNNNNNNNSINSLSRINNLSNQNSSFNGPSNTIRNLLASQTPLISLNEKPIVSNSNLRLSTGVLSAVGGSLQSNGLTGRQSYNSTINNLFSNIQKQTSSSSSPSPASSISSPTNALATSSFLDSKYQQDPSQMSALLTAISAPSDNQKKPMNADQSLASKSKRGRKASNSTTLELLNENGYDRYTNQSVIRTPQKSTNATTLKNNMESFKETKDKSSGKFNKQNKQFQQQQYEDNKPSFYLQTYPSENQLCSNNSSSRNLLINERNSSSNSPIDSPTTNPNHFNTTHTINSNMHANNYNMLNGGQTSVDAINDFNTSSLQRCNSSSNLHYVAASSSSSSTSIKASVLNSNDITNAPGVQRSLSRSNSLSSLNATNDQVSAEQKRRCNIQHGFDRLQTLVPSLRDGKNSKASKAAMLQKTSEYIKELQKIRQKRLNDLDVFKKEIEQLSNQISDCQSELPANGVSVVGNLNKTEKFEQKFKEYVKERTVDNWRFYLFSIILKPLFDNFIKTLNISSKEEIERTFHEWQEKYCNLIQLRPIISNSLRHLSKSTSILSDSSKLPEECYTAALTKI